MRLELDRNLVLDPSVRVLCILIVAEVILLRCLTDACLVSALSRLSDIRLETDRSRPVKHAHAEVPKQQSAIFAYTANPIVPFIASPGVELDCRDPRIMSLATCHQCALF